MPLGTHKGMITADSKRTLIEYGRVSVAEKMVNKVRAFSKSLPTESCISKSWELVELMRLCTHHIRSSVSTTGIIEWLACQCEPSPKRGLQFFPQTVMTLEGCCRSFIWRMEAGQGYVAAMTTLSNLLVFYLFLPFAILGDSELRPSQAFGQSWPRVCIFTI